MLVIFGDNQFLAVNHSGRRDSVYKRMYKSPDDIAVTLRVAWDAGIRDFAFTATPMMANAINLIIEDCPFRLHPCLPYAQNVNTILTRSGYKGLITHFSAASSYNELLAAAWGAFTGNYNSAIRVAIKAELAGLSEQHISSIGMLNVATDFLLGIRRYDILSAFIDVVESEYCLVPALYTMNFHALSNVVWGDLQANTRIIFNFNGKGFRTNPSLESTVESMRKFAGQDMMAMSLYSGASSEPPHVILGNYPMIRGVLFGSSSPKRIRDNFNNLSGLHL